MGFGSSGYFSQRTRRRRCRSRRQSLRNPGSFAKSGAHLESLEPRQLLAQLIGILPNDGQLLEEGQVLSVAPTQLTFRFDETPPPLNPSSIPSNIVITRSGFDGVFGNGNDVTITIGGQSGNFQLNVMLPVIAYNLLQSISTLASGSRVLADKAIADFTVNEERIAGLVGRNPILVTALNPVIGYETGAKVAKRAYAEGRLLKEVAQEETDLSEEDLDRLLDPRQLTEGGIQK